MPVGNYTSQKAKGRYTGHCQDPSNWCLPVMLDFTIHSLSIHTHVYTGEQKYMFAYQSSSQLCPVN